MNESRIRAIGFLKKICLSKLNLLKNTSFTLLNVKINISTERQFHKFTTLPVCSIISVKRTQILSLRTVRAFSARMASTNNNTDNNDDSDTIAFSDYDAIGFDVDHTLAKYNLPNLFNLAYECLATYLVKELGYDKSLLRPFHEDKDFNTRGIILDVEKGNFLKLSEDGTILRASHGTRFLSNEEIKKYYGSDCHLPAFDELIHTVNNIDGFRIFENFFDMPGNLICARLIDSLDKKAGKTMDNYVTPLGDVLAAYNHVYNPQGFKDDTGGFFPEYKKNIKKYVLPCSNEVLDWLKRLRKNKKLFIITSSYMDFATTIIEQALGAKWQEYFDICIFWSRKPGFFSGKRPFLNIDMENFCEKSRAESVEEGVSYSQGNQKDLMKFFTKITGKEDPKVIYFGDSLRSDIFPSKSYAGWETVLILEEMEAERHDVTKDEDEQPQRKIKKIMGPSEEEKEYLTSQYWGSLFCDGVRSDEMNTLWGYIIRKYADIAIPQLEYVTDFPLDHRYTVFDHQHPRKWGFYPNVPDALLKK